MTASIRISARSARVLRDRLLEDTEFMESADGRAVYELCDALKPRRKSPIPTRRAATRAKKATKKEETSAIYAEVEKRAAGRCEACERTFVPGDPPQMDHARGRGKAKQSAENTWLIHMSCHHLRHGPNPAAWLELYRAHSAFRGHVAEEHWAMARLAGVETVAKFGRAFPHGA